MVGKVDWDSLVLDYAHGAGVTDLAKKYDCSRQAIYKYFQKSAIKQTFKPNLPEISQITIDDRFAKMHHLYSALQDIQNAVEECSSGLRKSQFQMQALFRHMEELRESLKDIHETNMRKTIADLREQLRQGAHKVLQDDNNAG